MGHPFPLILNLLKDGWLPIAFINLPSFNKFRMSGYCRVQDGRLR